MYTIISFLLAKPEFDKTHYAAFAALQSRVGREAPAIIEYTQISMQKFKTSMLECVVH